MAGPYGPTGETSVVAVIGDPVGHSLSPSIHNAAFRHHGLDFVYVAFGVAAGESERAVDAMRHLGLAGMSVTMPHKSDIARHLDTCTDRASTLGAVNCVYRDGTQLVGDNTDGEGFVTDLSSRHGFDVAGRRCIVFGAGGAARSIVVALAAHGALSIGVVNRTRERAVEAVELAPGVAHIAAVDGVEGAELVVNATSIGMEPLTGVSPCPAQLFGPGQMVVDAVYHPRTTSMLKDAAQAGATVANGVGMLVGQAAIAYEHWTGTSAPRDIMYDAVTGHLSG